MTYQTLLKTIHRNKIRNYTQKCIIFSSANTTYICFNMFSHSSKGYVLSDSTLDFDCGHQHITSLRAAYAVGAVQMGQRENLQSSDGRRDL